MYIPKHFAVDDIGEKLKFIEQNAFGQLISHVNGKLFSTHLPVYLSPDKTQLIGHLAKPNPQSSQIDGQEVMVTLEGPHDYISPSWYAAPGVPTWNYQAVHIYGECQTTSDPAILKNIVETLTSIYESKMESPWTPEYKETMLGAIVGVVITIKEIQCKYKLSQNRSLEDRERVITKLKSMDSHALADAMQKQMPS